MKSVTSFFDVHTLRKDITRFAPAWGIYLIGGILVMLTSMSSNREYRVAQNIAETLGYFSIINMLYAGLVAQLLFGDLFNPRLCNALHAMPLRRETWFCSHALSGLLFSIVPNTIGIALLIPQLGSFWFIAPLWLVGMTLEYLFFFALAVFSVFCTGNRFAMAAVYAILNAASMLAMAFITSIYEPLMFGVNIHPEPFVFLCPVYRLTGFDADEAFFRFRKLTAGEMARGMFEEDLLYVFDGFGEGWGYLWILAAAAVILLVLSLLMYRRRALETAGDFMAVRPLAPVFSLIYTLTIGVLFSAMGDLMIGEFSVFLAVGIIIGYFTGQMLLQRTVKVFKPKTFLRCGGILVLLLVSMGLTWLDPLGITRQVPAPEKVQKIELDFSYSATPLVITDEEDIRKITDVHRQIIDIGRLSTETERIPFELEYTMENGTKIIRDYSFAVGSEVQEALKPLLSAPEYVLDYGKWYEDWDSYVVRVVKIRIGGSQIRLGQFPTLLNAIKADCEAGNMVQHHRFYADPSNPKHDPTLCRLTITYLDAEGNDWYLDLNVFDKATNTIEWLQKHHYIGYQITQ